MRYVIEGISSQGGLISIALDAISEEDARKQARTQGIAPNRVTLQTSWLDGSNQILSNTEILLFCEAMVPSLEAGVPARESLGFLASEASRPSIKLATRKLLDLLERHTFSEAVARAGCFPPLFCAAFLGPTPEKESFSMLRQYYGLVADLQGQILSVLVTPILCGLVAMVYVWVTLFKQAPLSVELFASLNHKPPDLLLFEVALSKFLLQWWWILIPVIIACLLLAYRGKKKVFEKLTKLAELIPSIASFFNLLRQVMTARIMSILGNSGIRYTEIFKQLADFNEGTKLGSQFTQAVRMLDEKGTIGTAVDVLTELTPDFRFLIKTGVLSGNIAAPVTQACVAYEKLARQRIEVISSFINMGCLFATAGFIILLVLTDTMMKAAALSGTLNTQH